MDALALQGDGNVLISISGDTTLPGVGSVDDSDIVRFVPTSTGSSTSGSFELYFDGSDVGLTTGGEDIDSIHLLDSGDLIVSTTGSFNVGAASGNDEDLIRFVPTSLGANTSGTWLLFFDGSDVGLNDSGNEDPWGVWLDQPSGHIYLTSRGPFSVSGAAGDGADILVCAPITLGANTACNFGIFWDGSASGLAGEVTDGLWIGQP